MKNFLSKISIKQTYFPAIAITLAVCFFIIAVLLGCERKAVETSIKGNDEKVYINQDENLIVDFPDNVATDVK